MDKKIICRIQGRRSFRLLIIGFAMFLVGCGSAPQATADKESVVGSWQLMGMTKTPMPIDKVAQSGLVGGRITFKSDGTLDGEVTYFKKPANDLSFSGTYSFENGMLTINNSSNGSTTKSTVVFKNDFMIATPVDPNGFITYYKRLN